MKKLVYFLISIISVAGLYACSQQELDGIQSQIDELKSTHIASISSQISNIQTSISALEKMDAELKASIEALSKKEEELESADEAQAKEIASLKESLTKIESALSKRIDDLIAYVDDELKKQSDWVTATFSTLEQYQSTCNEIASIKQSITDLESTLKSLISDSESSLNQKLTTLESTLKTLISDTETSIKSWVNEQLTGYYTIAQMDAKVAALEKSIADGDEAQAQELEKLKADLESAKTEIKAAYEKAISDAITESEGKINDKIAADIKTATDALQSQIDEINTKITEIEIRLGKIEASLEAILAQVQSIVVVPSYTDGRVEIRDDKDSEILFEVSPRSAALALAAKGPEVFSIGVIHPQTKASMFLTHLPVKSIVDNGECIAITIDAAQMDMETLNSSSELMARLKIDDGTSSMTTDYFPLRKRFVTTSISTLRGAIGDDRESYSIGDPYISTIKAEVISNKALNNLASSKLMFIQDYSAGIAVYCAAPHGYEFGDVLILDLFGATLKRYNGYLEIADLPLEKITKIGHKDEIEVVNISADDFFANKYESRYVAINGVQVINEDLDKTWVYGNTGTSIGIESAEGYEFAVYSPKASSYGQEAIPQGSGTIKGIASKYNDDVQLLFAQASDWEGLADTRFVIDEKEYYLSTTLADTKTSITGNQMVWKGGDKVLMNDGNISVLCTVLDQYDGNTTAVVKTKRPLSGLVSCIYPGDAVTQEGTSFFVDIPSDQGTNGSAYVVFSGSSTTNNISLSPRSALIKFTLSSAIDDLSSVRLSFEGAPVVGRLMIDENGASIVSGTQSVQVAAHGDNVFYFSVLPGTFSKMNADVCKTDGSFGRKTASNLSTSAETMLNISLNPSALSFNAVDLGLSVYWAKSNLCEDGLCANPEDYGDYYSWGETETKTDYSESNYSYKGNPKTLPLGVDVANVKLGGNWRMPTAEEWNELRNNCKWEWTTQNGINGYLVTSNKNGACIFLPAASYRYETYGPYLGQNGFYWSSSRADSTSAAYYLTFDSSKRDITYSVKYGGLSVRPVLE